MIPGQSTERHQSLSRAPSAPVNRRGVHSQRQRNKFGEDHKTSGARAVSAPGMDRRVDPNSLAAYESVNIARRQQQVFHAIADLHRDGFRPCDQDVAAYLRRPINTIGPRRFELVEAGLVERGGDKHGPNNHTVTWWRPAPQQLDLFAGARRS